jgi:hypothetical protein
MTSMTGLRRDRCGKGHPAPHRAIFADAAEWPQKNGKGAKALHLQNEGCLPGARSVERAGSAVELRQAPKARSAAHPQERSLVAGAGSTAFLQTRGAQLLSCLMAWRVPRPRSAAHRERDIALVPNP